MLRELAGSVVHRAGPPPAGGSGHIRKTGRHVSSAEVNGETTMKSVITMSQALAVIVFVTCSSESSGHSNPTSSRTPSADTSKTLIAAEQALNNGLLRGDWKIIEETYADDIVFTEADGSVHHKSDSVREMQSGDLKFTSIEMLDVHVQDLGNVAVVTGKLIEKGHYKTDDLSGTYRFTDVWVKRNSRWQLIAGHESRIP